MSTVLVVEDHFPTAHALKVLLARHGYEVDHVASGEAALDLLAVKQPDLMILDLGLGGMDGTEVLRRTRVGEATKEIPVVVFSALIDRERESELLKLGAQECWLKAHTDATQIIERVKVYLPPPARSSNSH